MSSVFNLKSANMGMSNRWILSIEPGHSVTDEAILAFIKSYPFPRFGETPVIELRSGVHTGGKRRIFCGDNGGVYFVESLRRMPNPTQFEGGEKTGRVVTSCLGPFPRPPEAPPLLFLKNKNILIGPRRDAHRALVETKDRIAGFWHGVFMTKVLSRSVPGVQKCLDEFWWTSRKGNHKVAYVCEAGREDLSRLSPVSFPMKRLFQLEMATILTKIYEKGYHNRDVKLANMIVSWDRQHVLLIDLDMCFHKNTVLEPKKIMGSPHYLPPEYALMCCIQKLLLASSPALIPYLTNEKGTVFTLGLSFLEMSGLSQGSAHLRPWCAYEERRGLNAPIPAVLQDRASFTPLSFREFLVSQDRSNQELAAALARQPLFMIERCPPDATSWERLLHQMVSPDPRDRPSLAEVSERIRAVIAEETAAADAASADARPA